MLKIGLTGGIASGKSTVTTLFAERGISIIDADIVAREVVEPGEPALLEIGQQFGPQVIDSAGQLDRQHLRDLVFADPERRKQLERILHPAIRARMNQHLQTCAEAGEAYCISAIPLLQETGQQRRFDRVLVVDVDRETQIQRLLSRDTGGREQAEAILASQADRQARLSIADDVINNRGNPSALAEQVEKLHAEYLQLALQNDAGKA